MITNRIRFSLFPQLALICFVLLLVGGYLVGIKGFAFGWILLGLGMFPFGVISGSQVDFDGGRIRSYNSFWGIRVGKWRPIQDFPELVMFVYRHSHGQGSVPLAFFRKGVPRGVRQISELSHPKEDVYQTFELYAADRLHQTLILLRHSQKKEKIERWREEISQQTGMTWVSYSPFGRFPKKQLG